MGNQDFVEALEPRLTGAYPTLSTQVAELGSAKDHYAQATDAYLDLLAGELYAPVVALQPGRVSPLSGEAEPYADVQRLAQAAPKLHVRYITREQHPDVFIRFLTNGGEAIPKFVFLSDQWVECGNWGPMPAADRVLIARGKACGDLGAARKKVGQSYQVDAERRIVVQELMALIEIAVCATP